MASDDLIVASQFLHICISVLSCAGRQPRGLKQVSGPKAQVASASDLRDHANAARTCDSPHDVNVNVVVSKFKHLYICL